jgi:hypothetical protein
MYLTRAKNRSKRYFKDHCQVIDPTNTQDIYGNENDDGLGRILYDGRCFISPGNMWPFETGIDVVRQGRTDVQVYVPTEIEGINADCILEADGHTYEVIGFAPELTAGASLNITARRVA